MKKVIILAYDFPPYVSVGGLRPYAWYRYFKESGIFPVVVTRQWSNKYGNHLDYIAASDFSETIIEETEYGTIVRAPYKPHLSNRLFLKYGESKFKIIRKLITAFYEFSQFLFLIGPKSSVYFAAKNYLETNKADLIIATGSPFILFKYAAVLSKKNNIPWIADYRDPWSRDHNKKENFIIQRWDIFFERKYSESAVSVITVSNFLKKHIASLLSNKIFYILPNGYDPETIEKIKGDIQDNKKFSIAFAGTIYKWHPLDSFLRVCSDFIAKFPQAEFRISFYGVNIGPQITDKIQSWFPNLIPIVNIYPKMPNELLVKKLSIENCFLLFNDYSILGTKVFDYLALKRLIIFCYRDDEEANKLKQLYYKLTEFDSESNQLQEDVINETKSGIVVKNAAHLMQVLKDLYAEFITKGCIDCNSVNTEQFSRKIQVQKLAEIIHNSIDLPEKKYQQCTRCVMDTSDPEITFDDKGYCNHCSDYFEKTSKRIYQGADSDLKLTQLVEKVKRAGKRHDYDCVIGISGGVDSLYTAYLAKKMGLRVLCVHMDNGWNSELATHNIEKILKKLEMELVTVVLDWEEFRDLQLSFLKASVPEAETPTDIAIPAALHQVATKYNIKYILSGGNFATEGILPKSWHYDAKDVKYLKAVHKKFGTKKLRSFPTFGFQKEMYYKFIKRIRMLYPLNYVPYNKKEAIKILEQELSWENYGGKHHESLYTKFIQSYLLFEKFGIDYRRATYSTQICAGEITREGALRDLCNKPYDPVKVEDEKDYICKKLSITHEELEKIIGLPPKKYKDYPNNKKILEFIYKVYRVLNK